MWVRVEEARLQQLSEEALNTNLGQALDHGGGALGKLRAFYPLSHKDLTNVKKVNFFKTYFRKKNIFSYECGLAICSNFEESSSKS